MEYCPSRRDILIARVYRPGTCHRQAHQLWTRNEKCEENRSHSSQSRNHTYACSLYAVILPTHPNAQSANPLHLPNPAAEPISPTVHPIRNTSARPRNSHRHTPLAPAPLCALPGTTELCLTCPLLPPTPIPSLSLPILPSTILLLTPTGPCPATALPLTTGAVLGLNTLRKASSLSLFTILRACEAEKFASGGGLVAVGDRRRWIDSRWEGRSLLWIEEARLSLMAERS